MSGDDDPASVVAARQLAAEARPPLPRRLSGRARLLVAARGGPARPLHGGPLAR